MLAGLRHVARAAVAVFCIALALPAIALAGGGGKCNASACKVYVEPNVPSAGGQQQPPATGPATGGQSGSAGGQQTPDNVSRVLAQAGKDKAPLSRVLIDSGLGNVQSGPGNVGSPSLLGAVSDLGAGPTALLAILLASALALAVHAGLRNRRRGRPSA